MFFFSSRRRHTRYIGDWSSDVCSSDLDLTVGVGGSGSQLVVSNSGTVAAGTNVILGFFPAISSSNRLTVDGGTLRATNVQIGRASCRERVEISGVEGGVKTRMREHMMR